MGLLDTYRTPAGLRPFYFRIQFGGQRSDHVINAQDLKTAFTSVRRTYPSALIYALDESKTPLAKDGLPV
jgi:hypothetical protein